VLMEDHVLKAGVVSSSSVQVKQWEEKMHSRTLSIDLRRLLLRHLGQAEWAGLSTVTKSRQSSSLAYETALLSRGMGRVGINRLDPGRTLLRQNPLGWILKAHVLKLGAVVAGAACAAPCFNYVHDGMQPLLGNPDVLMAAVSGDSPIVGSVVLGITCACACPCACACACACTRTRACVCVCVVCACVRTWCVHVCCVRRHVC